MQLLMATFKCEHQLYFPHESLYGTSVATFCLGQLLLHRRGNGSRTIIVIGASVISEIYPVDVVVRIIGAAGICFARRA